MTGQLDLGHDGDAAFSRVCHHLARFGLGIEAAVGLSIVLIPGTGDDRFRAEGTHFGQARILLDLDAPALVFGEMPMEDIKLVESQGVDELLDESQREDMPAHIQVDAAPAKSGPIADGDGWHAPVDAGLRLVSQDLWRQQLTQGLHPAQESGQVGRPKLNAPRRYGQLIGFRLALDMRQDDAIVRAIIIGSDGQGEARGGPQVAGQHLAELALAGHDGGIGIQLECAGQTLDALRLGEEGNLRHGALILAWLASIIGHKSSSETTALSWRGLSGSQPLAMAR